MNQALVVIGRPRRQEVSDLFFELLHSRGCWEPGKSRIPDPGGGRDDLEVDGEGFIIGVRARRVRARSFVVHRVRFRFRMRWSECSMPARFKYAMAMASEGDEWGDGSRIDRQIRWLAIRTTCSAPTVRDLEGNSSRKQGRGRRNSCRRGENYRANSRESLQG